MLLLAVIVPTSVLLPTTFTTSPEWLVALTPFTELPSPLASTTVPLPPIAVMSDMLVLPFVFIPVPLTLFKPILSIWELFPSRSIPVPVILLNSMPVMLMSSPFPLIAVPFTPVMFMSFTVTLLAIISNIPECPFASMILPFPLIVKFSGILIGITLESPSWKM